MTWRDGQQLVAVAAAGLLAIGCTHGDAGPPRADALPASTSATTVTGTASPAATTTPVRSGAPPSAASTRVDDESAPSGNVVEVSGGDLPEAVVAGYTDGGGDLVTPQEWQGRFGRSGLPTLSGPGVMLAEAVQRAERDGDRWERTDEASWLAMSNDDRDTVVSDLAAAAGTQGTPTRTAATEEAAACVADRYQPVDGVVWVIQGCTYERFPRMLAVGVSRTAPDDVPPAALDPTVTAIVEELDATITFSEVRFGAPGADGSTLHLSTQLSSDTDVAAAGDVVTAGALAGWQPFPGDRSLLLSGPTGATWTLSERVAVYAWAGRW